MLPVEIPGSTLFVLLLAATISFLMTLANRLLTDPEKLKAWRKEVAEWYEDFRKAQKSGDKKQMEKVMKKQQYIMQLQAKMSWQSMKVTLLFFIPILIIWQFLGGIYWQYEIAFFPGIGSRIPIPLFGELPSLMWWYLLCSYLFYTLFSHLFGFMGVE
ncbi:MAG: EMC3/TMCO1 family protein [Candidatus Bathyarchaeia archaeon]